MSDCLATLKQRAVLTPERPAFSTADETLTYAALGARVAGAAEQLRGLPETIGLLAPSSLDWLVVDLAGWAASKTIVPLPHFFSDAQLQHVSRDAGLSVVLASPDQMARVGAMQLEALPLPRAEAAPADLPDVMRGERIVYTSGSTGQPKGVRLGPAQLHQTCFSLMRASGAGHADRHLSVLPFSLLLEAVCGIYLPLLAGGHCRLAPEIVAANGIDMAVKLGEAAQKIAATTCVLVPQILQAWVMAAAVGAAPVPQSLRFIAVGGAAVPEALAERAWSLGLPVHEGYGLTECGSVVAVNRPGRRRPGTVGEALLGYDIQLAENGEILVRSDAVCQGYLNQPAMSAGHVWHTGDIGRFDADGYLTILGRQDNLIVTGNGRNIHPEWIETMLLADPRIARAVLLRADDGLLAVLLEPSPLAAKWFARADVSQLATLVGILTIAAPAYARPQHVRALTPDALAHAGLLTANGRPRRTAIAAAFSAAFTCSKPMEITHAFL